MSTRSMALFVLLLAGYLATFAYWIRYPLASDFTKFYASALEMRSGGDIYRSLDAARFDPERVAELGEISIHPNLNPPFLTILVLPLSWVPLGLASVLFGLASLGAGFLAMRLLTRELELTATTDGLIWSWILLLLFFPTWATIRFNQLSLFLFLLLVMCWRELRRRRDFRAGAVLGALMSVKLFTGFLLLPLLLRKRLVPAALAILVVSATWGLSVLVFGLGILSEYREALGRITWTGATWNASLLGFLSRLFGGSEGIALWEAPQLGRLCAAVLGVCLTIAFVWICRGRPQDAARDDICFALSLPLMLLLSPLGWMYYFPILLLPAALLWQRGRRVETGFFLGLATLPFPFQEAGAIDGLLDRFVFSGVYFYALLWLTLVLIKDAAGYPAGSLNRRA